MDNLYEKEYLCSDITIFYSRHNFTCNVPISLHVRGNCLHKYTMYSARKMSGQVSRIYRNVNVDEYPCTDSPRTSKALGDTFTIAFTQAVAPSINCVLIFLAAYEASQSYKLLNDLSLPCREQFTFKILHSKKNSASKKLV